MDEQDSAIVQPASDAKEVEPPPQLPAGLAFVPSYSMIAFDLALRWVTLILARVGWIGSIWLWGLQLVVIPVIDTVFAVEHDTRERNRHGLHPSLRMGSASTNTSRTVCTVVTAIGVIQIWASLDLALGWVRVVITGVLGLLYFLCVFVLAHETASVVPAPPGDSTPELYEDANDRAIIHYDTQRTEMAQRVETYTLESTLFGALAFSAFVAIVVSEKAQIKAVAMFLSDVGRTSEYFLAFRFKEMIPFAVDVGSEHNLFVAIAAETLLCSAFFLSVIVGRLRFNDMIGRAEYCVRVAAAFNRKEEALRAFRFGDKDDENVKARLSDLRIKIDESLRFADEALESLRPVVRYMSLFRNLGVSIFLLILITSGVWVSAGLAAFFAILCVVAFTYPSIDKMLRDRSMRHIIYFQKGPLQKLKFGKQKAPR